MKLSKVGIIDQQFLCDRIVMIASDIYCSNVEGNCVEEAIFWHQTKPNESYSSRFICKKTLQNWIV